MTNRLLTSLDKQVPSKIFVTALTLTLLFTSAPSIGWADARTEKVSSAEAATAVQRPSFLSRFIRRNIFNFDKLMRENFRLEPVSCSFTFAERSKATVHYEGLGACLYVNVFEGVRNQSVPGTIKANIVSLDTGSRSQIEVEWRPAPSSLRALIKTAWAMVNPFGKSPTLGALLEVIVLTFPKGTDAAELLGAPVLRSTLDPAKGDLQQIVVSFSPNSENPKNESDAIILFFQSRSVEPSYTLAVSTTFDVLDSKAPFVLKAEGNAR